jgi:hypothetical protein
MSEEWQYVIMFNSRAEEVMPLGSTQEQANARAVQLKKDYLTRNKTVNPGYVFIYATNVRVCQTP